MHPTDGELRAKLDESIDPRERHLLQLHVDRCDRCRQQMAKVARGRLIVGALLEELEAPIPARFVEPIVRRARQRRSHRRGLVAAAAALLIVSAAGATITSGGLHEVARRFTSPRSPVEGLVRPAAPHADDGLTGVAFAPTNDVQIEFAAAQTEGELQIVLGAGPQVTVTASEPVPYALRSGKVTVDNKGVRASYRVALPKDLERAAIRVAGRVVFAKRQSAIVTEATREGTDSFRVALVQRKDAP